MRKIVAKYLSTNGYDAIFVNGTIILVSRDIFREFLSPATDDIALAEWAGVEEAIESPEDNIIAVRYDDGGLEVLDADEWRERLAYWTRKEPSWGGKRQDAGRPAVLGAGAKYVSVKLAPGDITAAKELGGGNVSEGIRRALAKASA